MSTDDLRTLLREDVAATEPAFTMSSREPIRQGRRRLRARRWGASLGCAVVLAACVITVPQLLGPARSHSHAGPTSQQPAGYDAQKMPRLLERSVSDALGAGVPAFRDGTVVARDSQDQKLPAKYYAKASSWEAHYSWSATHLFTATLSHSPPGLEKDIDHVCEHVLRAAYLTCVMERQGDGMVQVTTTSALREDRIPTAGETGPGFSAVKHVDKVNPDRLWFARSVITIRAGNLRSLVEESVKTPTAASAADQWSVNVDDLRKVGVRVDLPFPEPPVDAQSGCGWYLPNPDLHPSCTR